MSMMRMAIHSKPDKLVVVVRPQLNWFLLLVFPVCTAVVFCAFIIGSRAIFQKVFGAVCLLLLFWYWITKLGQIEKLDFTALELTQRSGLFGMTRKSTFEMERIREPRFIEPRPGRAGLPTGFGFFYERIAFQTCDGISQAQANTIIAAVVRQFPELAPVWGTLQENWGGDGAGLGFTELQ